MCSKKNIIIGGKKEKEKKDTKVNNKGIRERNVLAK